MIDTGASASILTLPGAESLGISFTDDARLIAPDPMPGWLLGIRRLPLNDGYVSASGADRVVYLQDALIVSFSLFDQSVPTTSKLQSLVPVSCFLKVTPRDLGRTKIILGRSFIAHYNMVIALGRGIISFTSPIGDHLISLGGSRLPAQSRHNFGVTFSRPTDMPPDYSDSYSIPPHFSSDPEIYWDAVTFAGRDRPHAMYLSNSFYPRPLGPYPVPINEHAIDHDLQSRLYSVNTATIIGSSDTDLYLSDCDSYVFASTTTRPILQS